MADSSTRSARAIRADLTRRTNAGQSDASIRSVYVARYGPSILLNPPASGLGLLVRVLPSSPSCWERAGWAFAVRRWRRTPRLATDADEASCGSSVHVTETTEAADTT